MPAAPTQTRKGSDRAGGRARGNRNRRTFAFLVGLAFSDGDQNTRGAQFEIRNVERHKLRSPERTRETQQQNGPIAQVRFCIPCGADHRQDSVRGRGFLRLGAGRRRSGEGDDTFCFAPISK